MKNPDWLSGPPPNEGEPESKERIQFTFRHLLLETLREKVLEKKFGEKFFQEYRDRRFFRETEEKEGERAGFDSDKLLEALGKSLDRERQLHNPLLPEVEQFIERLDELTTTEEILEVASAEGASLTQADVDEAKMFIGRIMNKRQRGIES